MWGSWLVGNVAMIAGSWVSASHASVSIISRVTPDKEFANKQRIDLQSSEAPRNGTQTEGDKLARGG